MSNPHHRVAQADLLMLMAEFWRPPETTENLNTQTDRRDLQALVEATGLRYPRILMDQLEATLAAQDASPRDEREGVFRALFDGRIGCPINEATFVRRDKGAIIGDLCGFYQAFGWEHQSNGERADHLRVELEFVAMLLIMAARAESEQQQATTMTALAEFARMHPNDWILPFCEQIRQSTTHPWFIEASKLLELVWKSMIDFHGWTVDSVASNPVGICEEPENPYECGAPDLVSLETEPH